LFFHDGRGDIMRAVLEGGPNVLAAAPTVALRPCADQNLRFGNANAVVLYDVAADGRFLVGCSQPEDQPTAITVVVNWQSRLR
jgi:hypothetical protein